MMEVMRLSERELGRLAGKSHTVARKVVLGLSEGFCGDKTRTQILGTIEQEALRVQKALSKLSGGAIE
jgi:hypothetical protein